MIAAGLASLQFPYARTLSAWYAGGSVGRLDLASGAECADAVAMLMRLEDQLWRWIVDHSRVIVVSTRPSLHQAVEQWFLTLLAHRNRLDGETARQRYRELVDQSRWLALGEPLAP